MRFIDEVTIHCISGHGGAGCVSFRREKFIPFGGPNGGDGGRGGDIIFEASRSLSTLLELRHKPHQNADRGRHGMGKDRHGAAGSDLVIKVPAGTVIRDAETGEQLADMTEDGMRVVLLKGGRGGQGNARFATSTNKAPKFAQPGEDGEERKLRLELKLMADVGLLGLPNAGKSSLISKVSAARPRVADYPFTTIAPSLGVVAYKNFKSFVMADIPERDPFADYDSVNRELELFSEELGRKPQIVALTKMDLPDAKTNMATAEEWFKKRGVAVYPISSATGEGIESLLDAIARQLWGGPQEVW